MASANRAAIRDSPGGPGPSEAAAPWEVIGLTLLIRIKSVRSPTV